MRKIVFLVWLSFVLLSAVFFVGCKSKSGNSSDTINFPDEWKKTEGNPAEGCWVLCKTAKAEGRDLSNGPCLEKETIKNVPPEEYWVCDVAHSPRTDVDNNPENQCSAFREGKAKHFIELDENCKIIKIY